MSGLVRLLEFSLAGQRYALHLGSVDKVVRSVEVALLPGAPEVVSGVVNVHGRIFPVFNMRKRFGIPDKEIDLTDQFIIARTKKRTVILLTDGVTGVIERPEQEVTRTEKIIPGMEYIEGIVKFEDDMIFIHDLNKFLSLDEEKALDDALYQ